MASKPQISGVSLIIGKSNTCVVEDIGTALLQVKNARGLRLADIAEALRKSDDQVAKYIAGESEMGVVAWLRACEEYPEIIDRLTETAAERSARAKQRSLDLELTRQKDMAA
jgi:transcriptional regulator with XRE-family HTH domain